jgi:hypothetical protein
VKVAPYHSEAPEKGLPAHRNVYHDQSTCPDGVRIKPEYRVTGRGGRKKCDWCRAC